MALGTGLTLVGLGALAIHPHAIAGYLPYGTGTIRLIADECIIGLHIH